MLMVFRGDAWTSSRLHLAAEDSVSVRRQALGVCDGAIANERIDLSLIPAKALPALSALVDLNNSP